MQPNIEKHPDFIALKRKMAELEQENKQLKTKNSIQFKHFPVPAYTWTKKNNGFILSAVNNAGLVVNKLNEKQLLDIEANAYYSSSPEIIQVIDECFTEKKEIKRELTYQLNGKKCLHAFSFIYIPENSVTVYSSDISKHRDSLRRLKKTETKFQKLFQLTPEAVFLTHIADGRFLELNKQAEILTGYTQEEIFGKTADEVNEWRSPTDRKKYITELMGKGECLNLETTFKGNNNKIFDAIISGKITDYEGKGCIISVVQDITERKKAEQALRESENKFRSIIENSNDGIVLTNETGKIIEWNVGQEKITKIKRRDAIGRDIWAIQYALHYDAENKQPSIEFFRGVALKLLQSENKSNENKSRITEHKIRVENQLLTIQSLEFFIETGKGYRLASINRNITEHRKAIEKIKQSESQLRAIFDNSRQAFFYIDKTQKLHLVNAIGEQIVLEYLGIKLSTSIDTRDLFSRMTNGLHNKHIKKVLAGKTTGSEVLLKNKNSEKWFELLYCPVYEEKKELSGIFINAIDIDQRKKALANIRKALIKEKEVHKMKSQFISTASHEFRTPIGGIYTNVQFLHKQNKKEHSDKNIKFFNRIYASINYLTNILDEIQLISKDQIGMLQYNPKIVDFYHICTQTIEEVEQLYPDALIQMEYNVESKDLFLDEYMMHMILINLLTNAVKYSVAKRSVKLQVFTKNLKEYGNNKYLHIIVKDQGMGIPSNEAKYVFKEFFRGSNTKHVNGTGLGTSIIKRCTEAHKGLIDFESKINKGSTFIVKIPI